MAEVPTYADCSSFVSWIFWTTFGEWPDYLNNQNWAAGYTGTMYAMGRDHPVSAANRQKGDVVLYGTPTVNHATLYVRALSLFLMHRLKGETRRSATGKL